MHITLVPWDLRAPPFLNGGRMNERGGGEALAAAKFASLENPPLLIEDLGVGICCVVIALITLIAL